MRVLLGQDFGDGFGHASRLASIAEPLRQRGCTVLLALRDAATVAPLLQRAGLPFIQGPRAPVSPLPEGPKRASPSFADLLARGGFDRPEQLRPVLDAWQALLEDFAPDLVIADYAPALCLAAWPQLPVVRVGNGYTTPPADGAVFPPFIPDPPIVGEAVVLAAVREVQRQRGRPVPETLPEPLRGAATFVTHLAALDPYRKRRQPPAQGPLQPLPAPAETPPETGYFAYLSAAFAGTRTVLKVLAASGRPGSIFLRDAPAKLVARLRDRGLVLHEAPQPMVEAATRARVVIHHGGPATIETVLAIGRPQLLVARHIEHRLNALAAGDYAPGASLLLHGQIGAQEVEAALASLETETALAAAEMAARRLRKEAPPPSLDQLLTTCLGLAGDRAARPPPLRPRRVLLGQELGHEAGRLAALALALRRRGCEVLLAVRDPILAQPLLAEARLAFVQAPCPTPARRAEFAGRTSLSFADTLAHAGFDRPERLVPVLDAWQGLLDTFQPDLVIADNAPALCLAAWRQLPVVRVGSGYTVPPADGPRFLDFLAAPTPSPAEATVLAAVAEAQRQRRRPVPETLTEPMRGAAAFVTHLPELDPYRKARERPVLGPLEPLPAPAETAPVTDYFADLEADHPGTRVVLEALAASGARGAAHIRAATPELEGLLRGQGLVLHDAPVPLVEAAGRAAVVIHHGDVIPTEAVLAIGRPQLVVPRQVEQRLTAQALAGLGPVRILPSPATLGAAEVTAALTTLRQPEAAAAAQRAARQIAAAGPFQGLERVVEACLDLLPRQQHPSATRRPAGRPPRVLLGHDCGAGHGHVAVLLPVARALRQRGWEVLVAVRDLTSALPLLEPSGLPFVQAPSSTLPPRPGQSLRVASFADFLPLYGLEEADRLMAMVQGWEALLAAWSADLVIADFAPVLGLAARGRAPVVRVGSGWTNPPADGATFPPFGAPSRWPGEAELLATVNLVQQRRRQPALTRLPEILDAAAVFVTDLPALDPYVAERQPPAGGPLEPLPPPATTAPVDDYFAYLALDHGRTATVLKALIESGLSGSVYLREATPAQRAAWRERGLVVHDAPQPMAEAVGRASFVIHHGGIGTTQTVLALGRPQLFVPRHQEQSRNLRAAARLGVALGMKPGGPYRVTHVHAALNGMREQHGLHDAARAEARKIADAGPFDGLARLVETCERLVWRPDRVDAAPDPAEPPSW